MPFVRVMETAVAGFLLHSGDVTDADRLAGLVGGRVLTGDPKVLDLLQRGEGSADLDGAALALLGEGTGRDRGAACLEGLGEGSGIQSGGRELLVVGGDGDLEVLDTVDGDLADAVDVLQGGDDGAVQLVGERLLVLVGRDGEDDGRDVVRRTGDDLRVDIVGQLDAGAVDRLLDVGDQLLRALVAEVEGRHDDGVALAGGRGDARDSVDGLDGVLERFDDLLLDHIGRRTLVGGEHRHHREFDGGQQLLLELRDRDRSEDERDDRDQPDQGPLREAESGQPGHGWVSLLWLTRQVGG